MSKFKLTGNPVSEELENVIQRLNTGTYVPIEDIENTPEIRLARSCINNSISTDRLSGREDLQEYVLEELQKKGSAVLDEEGRIQYNVDIRKDSRLDIVIGLPASGKSSAVVDVISNEFHSRIIDNDEAKKLLPEYNNGWGAGVVHEEAKIISEAQLQNSLRNHENIVLPKVGANPEKINEVVQVAKKLDYKVNVHFVDLEREKALGRMLNRFIEDGRFLDPELIDKYCNNVDGNKISKCYETLKKGGNLDGYSKWNNDVKRGKRPILVEAECTGDFIRDAGTAGNVSRNIRDDGSIRDKGGRSVSGHGGKSGPVENTDKQRGFKENKNDSPSGRRGNGSTKQSILKKLAAYKGIISEESRKSRNARENPAKSLRNDKKSRQAER
jgi:Zeta toxin.